MDFKLFIQERNKQEASWGEEWRSDTLSFNSMLGLHVGHPIAMEMDT